MIKIGIDPSINSTGICVVYNQYNYYYLIPSKMTKKMDQFKHPRVSILPYNKYNAKNEEYSKKEKFKTLNIYNICSIIKRIVELWKEKGDDIIVYMEGVSYGSVGSAALVDLSGLNFAIRITLQELQIPFEIISPTSVKKFAVANGSAEKDIIIDAWKRLDPIISNIKDIKIDDLADSYFLAYYESI